MNYRLSKLEFFSICLVIFIGATCLLNPFYGDQSFFLLGAKRIYNHGILYKDFWDIKQPGIFFFYFIAGKIFGFTTLGIHLFEFLVFLIYSYILILFFKAIHIFKNENLISLTALLTVGLYFINGGITMLTQVESIVNIPIQLIIFTNYLAIQSKGWRRFILIFISGILSGVIIQFKLFFIFILISIYGVAFVHQIQTEKLTAALKTAGILIIGFIVSLIPFVIYTFHFNIEHIVYQTFFIYPFKIVTQHGLQDFPRLIKSIKGFFKPLIGLIIPALIGIIFRQKRILIMYYVIWIISSALVIYLQKTSWWQYHFQLLFTPIGILSVFGLDIILEQLSKFKMISKYPDLLYCFKIIIIVLIFLPSIIKLSYKLYRYEQYIHKSYFRLKFLCGIF